MNANHFYCYLLYFFLCVIFTYYCCEYVYNHCVSHAYYQTYSVFYNFHLFIIISQRRQKHFQFAMINDVGCYIENISFFFSLYDYYYDAYMYIQRCYCHCCSYGAIKSRKLFENEKLLVNRHTRLLIKRNRTMDGKLCVRNVNGMELKTKVLESLVDLGIERLFMR